MRIVVIHEDGTELDITEPVKIAYDCAYGSMDWGSDFLDFEEMEGIAALGVACRFPSGDEALEGIRERRDREEAQRKARLARESRAMFQSVPVWQTQVILMEPPVPD